MRSELIDALDFRAAFMRRLPSQAMAVAVEVSLGSSGRTTVPGGFALSATDSGRTQLLRIREGM